MVSWEIVCSQISVLATANTVRAAIGLDTPINAIAAGGVECRPRLLKVEPQDGFGGKRAGLWTFWRRMEMLGLRERLLSRIQRIPGPLADDCWVWVGGRNNSGYGQVWYEQEVQGAHRVWKLFKGPIPAGMWVLHRCDRPPCCNVGHLWLGTPLDNVKDMIAKGRQAWKRRYDRSSQDVRG
jgi:HNH endonuclease